VSRVDPVRAWKDPLYRDSLSAEERAGLEVHPSGLVEIGDAELKAASGAEGLIVTTFRTCTEYTFKRFHCCP
jgi:mersacidin/lichenicidin family type 2 lantibiotic